MGSNTATSDLRRGWTTGTCAAAAAKAAAEALLTGGFPDPVFVTLPGGQRPGFALALEERGEGYVRAGIIKDAGDDPDVTHGALVVATVRHGTPGSGISFRAGEGVGTVTRPGLPLAVGEPAINPVPRQMIATAIKEVVAAHGGGGDFVVKISIPNGEELAKKTLNGRLGIVGGLSILGTTGIVVPFSCAAWIDTIHRGIDVARALGHDHIAGAVGSTSEAAIAALDRLPETALIDMGDFVGGMLKYLKRHPVDRVTIAGGFAKMVKLSQGLADLHSRAGSVDLDHLARLAAEAGASGEFVAAIPAANSALDVLQRAEAAGIDIAAVVAARAAEAAVKLAAGSGLDLDIAVFDRAGHLLARSAVLRA